MSRKTLYEIAKDHQLLIVLTMLIIMFIGLYFNQRSNYPKFAIVSKDWKITYESNFDEYGLIIEKRRELSKDILYSVYLIRFRKVPRYWEVSTQEAAAREIEKIDERTYRIIFVRIGGWMAVGEKIECDFKIQAF